MLIIAVIATFNRLDRTAGLIGRESSRLQLDTRVGDASPVVTMFPGDRDWEDTIVQADSIDDFIESAEAGTFEVVFDDMCKYRPRR